MLVYNKYLLHYLIYLCYKKVYTRVNTFYVPLKKQYF